MKIFATVFFVLLSFSLPAQTIFQYGNDSVSVTEFLRAWHKNNTGPKNEKAFRDYLNLYIASRLKIKEAEARGYDTLPQLVSDLANLRQQILPSYLTDKEAVNKLVKEAYSRSQKDIHLAHIFISFMQNEIIDSAAALKKLNDVLTKLKTNENFAEVAKQFSDDPSAKTNDGDLGWITVFTLPYEMENLAYDTPVGKISSVYKSKTGYHIFKNLGERRDPGRIKAAEILLAFPPDADEQTKDAIKNLADSLYKRLQKGDDFAKLATQFSNDIISSAANGQMQEFGVGEYDPAFEKIVFAMKKDGEISKPFLMPDGYHIVKRISRTPVVSVVNDKAMQALKERVEQSDRMSTTKIALANKIIKSKLYKRAAFNDAELWIYSDSILNYKTPAKHLHLNASSVLFSLGSKKVTVADWISYAQTFRYKSDGSGIKPYSQIWTEFLQSQAIDYYQSHLENFNQTFRRQMAEFKEGNLFFEIMQRQIWGPAQTDTVALLKYYNNHKSNYTWNHSANAVIFYASDLALANTFYDQLKKSPGAWHNLVKNFSEKIAADSSRFEISQIPNPSKKNLKAGSITAPLINKTDKTVSFAYIIQIYEKPARRSFSEARGLVINDYQAALEKTWIAELKKKYPVKINQKNFDELVKNKKY